MHVLDLPRHEVPARFESDLLLRLDQALGAAFEPFEPLHPPEPRRRVVELEEPVGLEGTLHVLHRALEELTMELAHAAEGTVGLTAELVCSEADGVQERVVLSRPSADLDHLWSLLAPRFERAELGFGVLGVTLTLDRVVPLDARQVAFDEGARSEERTRRLGRVLGETLDTLIGRLGRERVRRIEPVEAHLPELAFRSTAWLTRATRVASGSGASPPGAARITPLERPARFHVPPFPIDVDVAGAPGEGDERPVRYRWRGAEHRVVQAIGPERLEPPWWGRRRSGARDYYRTEDEDGTWLWIARESDGRWFVHGEWV